MNPLSDDSDYGGPRTGDTWAENRNLILHQVRELKSAIDELKDDIEALNRRSAQYPFSAADWKATDQMLQDWKIYKDKFTALESTVKEIETDRLHRKWLRGIVRATIFGLSALAVAIVALGESMLKGWHIFWAMLR